MATTDAKGMYAIDGMKIGTYTVSVRFPSIYFNDIRVKVLPSEPQLPIIIPHRYRFCTRVLLTVCPLYDLEICHFGVHNILFACTDVLRGYSSVNWDDHHFSEQDYGYRVTS